MEDVEIIRRQLIDQAMQIGVLRYREAELEKKIKELQESLAVSMKVIDKQTADKFMLEQKVKDLEWIVTLYDEFDKNMFADVDLDYLEQERENRNG